MGFRPLRAKVKILGNIRASEFRLSQLSRVIWFFSSVDLLCFLVVVLVVVESGDSLVARVVGEVFRCDLCDPCMMLSCAFILVKKKIFWLVFHPCFQGSPGGALHLVAEPGSNIGIFVFMLPTW